MQFSLPNSYLEAEVVQAKNIFEFEINLIKSKDGNRTQWGWIHTNFAKNFENVMMFEYNNSSIKFDGY